MVGFHSFAASLSRSTSSATMIAELLPFSFHRVGHILGGGPEPIRFPPAEIREYGLDAPDAAQVDIGRLSTHGGQQRLFLTLSREIRDVNGICIGRQAPNQPSTFDGLKRITGSDSRRDYAFVERLTVTDSSFEPEIGRWDHRFRFSRNQSSSDRDRSKATRRSGRQSRDHP